MKLYDAEGRAKRGSNAETETFSMAHNVTDLLDHSESQTYYHNGLPIYSITQNSITGGRSYEVYNQSRQVQFFINELNYVSEFFSDGNKHWRRDYLNPLRIFLDSVEADGLLIDAALILSNLQPSSYDRVTPRDYKLRYIIKSGDTFNIIAKQIYGDSSYAIDIARTNGYSHHDEALSEGLLLTLPFLDTQEVAENLDTDTDIELMRLQI